MTQLSPGAGQHSIPHATMSAISDLADVLLRRGFSHDHHRVVVPIIGAGASASAGLPTSAELKMAILGAYVGERDPNHKMYESLRYNAKEYYGIDRDDVLEWLSLPAFCAVVGLDPYGKKCIKDVVRDRLSAPKRRPLVCELIAHLVKHGCADHVISLNFDRLQDDAMRDELFDDVHIIAGPEDVPEENSTLAEALAKEGCYFVKPFGSLERDRFSLTPDEIQQYGRNSVWSFCQKPIFLNDSSRPIITLILVGYSASEAAFLQLIDALRRAQRHIEIFVIDVAEEISQPLKDLNAKHIKLDADSALAITLKLMKNRRKNDIWVPVARHEIISAILNNDQLSDRRHTRFEIELLLQGIKSRGLLTLAAAKDVNRILFYAHAAQERLRSLCNMGVITSRPWTDTSKSGDDISVQDYRLTTSDPDVLAEQVINIANKKCDDVIADWTITEEDTIISQVKTLKDYVRERVEEIESGPDIEISMKAGRKAALEFTFPRYIRSMQELTERTREIFEEVLSSDDNHPLEIRGIWSTGEWIFYRGGWAFNEIGKTVLERVEAGTSSVRLVLADDTDLGAAQKERAAAIRDEFHKTGPFLQTSSDQVFELVAFESEADNSEERFIV